MTFTSVKRQELQRAFALAHRASEKFDTPAPFRRKFRQIAQLIWEAHGELGSIPQGAGEQLLAITEEKAAVL